MALSPQTPFRTSDSSLRQCQDLASTSSHPPPEQKSSLSSTTLSGAQTLLSFYPEPLPPCHPTRLSTRPRSHRAFQALASPIHHTQAKCAVGPSSEGRAASDAGKSYFRPVTSYFIALQGLRPRRELRHVLAMFLRHRPYEPQRQFLHCPAVRGMLRLR